MAGDILKRIFSIIVICSLLFISSCSLQHNTSSSTENAPQKNTSISTTENTSQESTTVADDYNMIFENCVTFYKLSRENFDTFLEKPLHSFLKNNCSSEVTLTSAGTYLRGSPLFTVNDDFLNLFGNVENLENYLKENNYDVKIENTAIIDAPKMPIIIWIGAADKNIFITVDEKDDDLLSNSTNTFRIYSHDNFSVLFRRKTGKLFVLGKEAKTSFTPQIYYDYADICFTDVLNALNIKTETKKDLVYIYTESGTYILNQEECSLYEKSNKKQRNLLQLVGGYQFIYSDNGKLILDSSTLKSALYSIGIKVSVKIDSTNGNINIEYR